eukprot:gb/GECG01015013.1/.p1 GENE.gb/GECG01015013.1/~~gb/GECG01015013.1/.p1  ORF type:complete len:214 (+),score=23.18 gb/GECG01015013.1/:1-642(+)
MEWETYQVPVLLLVLVATVLFVFYSYGPLSTTKTQEEVTLESRSETEQKPQHGSSTGTKASTQQPGKSMNKLVQEANKKMAAKEKTPEHPLFSRIFRSGKSPITAFAVSSHGKVVALGTQDTSIHIIFINRPKESSGNQPSFKLNIEFDFASALAFSEDEKILCVVSYFFFVDDLENLLVSFRQCYRCRLLIPIVECSSIMFLRKRLRGRHRN